jgi:hypothetical protein
VKKNGDKFLGNCVALLALNLLPLYCFSIDSSVILGRWSGTCGKHTVEITFLSDSSAVLLINGKKATGAKLNLVYGKPSIYPFVSVYAAGDNESHYIYLTVGPLKDSLRAEVMRGFHEVQKTTGHGGEEIEVSSHPLDLRRLDDR